jgi:hypothetical protein
MVMLHLNHINLIEIHIFLNLSLTDVMLCFLEPSDGKLELLGTPKASSDSCFVENSAKIIRTQENRKPILKSTYFKHKQSDDHDQESLGEEISRNKEKNYVRGNTYRSILKRRKLVCNLHVVYFILFFFCSLLLD